jgi:hypothetical protein
VTDTALFKVGRSGRELRSGSGVPKGCSKGDGFRTEAKTRLATQGESKSTVRYLGIDVDDALEIAGQTEV